MRQLGDLLVWAAMIMALLGVLYIAPRISQYISDEGRPANRTVLTYGLALAEAADPVE